MFMLLEATGSRQTIRAALATSTTLPITVAFP